MLSLTCLIMPIDKVIITQTILAALFTSRSLSHLGETLRCLIWCLPPGIRLLPTLNYLHPPFLQTLYDDQLCLPFCKVLIGGGRTLPFYGAPQHLPLLTAISYSICNPVRALLPHWPQGLGGTKKNSRMISPACWYLPRRRPLGIESMAFLPYG